MPPDPQSTCVRWCLNSRWNASSSCLWGLSSTGGTFPGEVHGLSIPWHVCCRTSWQVGPAFYFILLIFVRPNYVDILSNFSISGRVNITRRMSKSCLILNPTTEMDAGLIECACVLRWTVIFRVFGGDGGGGSGGTRSFICISSTWLWWLSEPGDSYHPGRKHRWGLGAWYHCRYNLLFP